MRTFASRAGSLTVVLGLMLACTTSHAKSQDPKVVFKTNKGTIVIELFADKAPISTKNMLHYVSEGFYNGVIFHRVIPGFMIQGGGFTTTMKKKPVGPTIKNEATNGLSNKRGTVAMARTSVIDSATSQFFINLVNNTRLDHSGNDPYHYGYAVFGKVIKGMDVVDAIAKVPTCPNAGPSVCTKPLPPGMANVPATPVIIEKAYREK